MSPKSGNTETQLATWKEVVMFLSNASKFHNTRFMLPTLEQLKIGLASPGVEAPVGPEWTRERFIYDSHTAELINNPKSGHKAAFRYVIEDTPLPEARSKKKR